MNAKPNGIMPTRRRALTAVVCSVVVAVTGGALLSGPAYASDITSGVGCATTRVLGGLTIGDVDCGAPTAAGTATPTAAPVPAAPVPAAHEETASTAGSTSGATTRPASARTATQSSAGSAPLADVTVRSSTDSVYPVRDGYLDDVRFEVRALGAAGQLVPVEGTAILSKGSAVASTWTLDTATTVLTWDGRVGGKIRRGVYTLLVTLYSADGSTRTTVNRIRVLTKHVVRRAVVVHSVVRGNDTQAAMPAQVLKAYAKGTVTVRVRTVAKVQGRASLVYSNDGVARSIALRDGVHTTKPLIVPKGFEHVTITHRWAKGAAKLKSANAIWTYYTLVK